MLSRAQSARGRDVDDEDHEEIPLLHELSHVGRVAPGRDLPVDGADVVPGLIGTDEGELESTAVEDRRVITAEEGFDEVPGTDLEAPDPAEDLGTDLETSEG